MENKLIDIRIDKEQLKAKKDQFATWASDITGAASDTVASVIEDIKDTAERWNDEAEVAKNKKDLLTLSPVFLPNLQSGEFKIPAMLCVVDEPDKKHAESKACAGSIGFLNEVNGVQTLNVYRSNLAETGLSCYPDNDKEVYYIDPSDKSSFIALDNYFDRIKKARVNELVKIAYDLGAKSIEVNYITSAKMDSVKKKSAKLKAKEGKDGGGAEANSNHQNKESSVTTVAASQKTEGNNNPQRPNLVYFKNEEDILDLIDMRMNGQNKVKEKSYTFKSVSSSCMKYKDAVKIDGALQKLKLNAGVSMEEELATANSTVLEYKVEF